MIAEHGRDSTSKTNNTSDKYAEKISLAFTGASGAQYGLRLLEYLVKANKQIYLMLSPAAQMVLAEETELNVPGRAKEIQEYFSALYHAAPGQLLVFGKDQWTAPVASGTNQSSAMVVCPCSSGTLASIATGNSDNLIERAADVMIKEQRKLILVPREMPFSVIHLENMLKLARIGVTIMPANPGFYTAPQTIGDLVDFVVARILDHLYVPHTLTTRWGEPHHE
jgi:4-hydroxy-3-polyprenylbenzoate decarboxylase